MQQWRKYVSRLVAAGLFAGAVGWSAAAVSETVLTFNRWTPATHHFHSRIYQPWAERVEHATEGRVKIRFTPASLGAPPRQFDLARTGVADLTSNNQAYTVEIFPLAMFAELPFVANSAESLSVANWRATQALMAEHDEYKDVKLLGVFSNGPAMVFTRKKPIRTIDDIQGLRTRTSDGIPSKIAARLGAIPITAPVTEAYQMLSKGIIDSVILPPDSIYSFKMDQYLDYMTRIPKGLYSSTFFLVMNKAKWDALSQEDQEGIMSVSGENLAIEAGKVWDDQDRIAIEAFEERGMQIADPDPALITAIEAKLAPITEEWLQVAQSKGVDGQALLDEVQRHIKEYESEKKGASDE
ncbi:TRAP transporter substrate-binding protein [Pusillimonas sp.]|uniref:TRAP transporter substrate-binding protein n=1 Tax=Pusillimonas sp. TaxID=3040095 RepID=UPI0037C94214